ncbi:hypothetical protein OHB26_14430 [Nocardia sp. NBC_01503]|uniref:hypothetical protein n=1 Tax=Nocardia sp. NBC_01503 TaxID=2975997 RepID=UPI002E7BE449|nr:hypothetical protein [Nocardia sp. NBC_01503]WTL35281.1 hypothetical protein OHB26_14430 [Nocardia sp. NBC_01503]
MNSHPAPRSRKSFRLSCAALLTGLFAILGLIAAVADWGSAQQISVQAVTAPGDTVASTHAPFCERHDQPGQDPLGQVTAPPRATGDQLLTPVFALIPELPATQRLSYDIAPRGPTLPMTSPHLTTVLII